jgi:hypothetical protein
MNPSRLAPDAPEWRAFGACKICLAPVGEPCRAQWAEYTWPTTGTTKRWKPRNAGTYCRQAHPGRKKWDPQRGRKREYL